MGGEEPGGNVPMNLASRIAALEDRLAELESRLAAMAEGISTRRFVLVGEGGEERLVAQIVGGVTELRLGLPGRRPGRRTSLLVFAAPRQPDWCAGLGLQLWVDGNVVEEMTWWEDQETAVGRPSDGG